jgi:hypothetical protein
MSVYGTEWRDRGYGLWALGLEGDSVRDRWLKPVF